MAVFVLILVMHSPMGYSGLTSQSVDGFTSIDTCNIAATEALKVKWIAGAKCVERK